MSKRVAPAPDHADDTHSTEVHRHVEDTEEITFTESSGNVWADLGFPDAEGRMAKAELAMRIHDAIKARGLTQTKAAELLGIDQPKVSAIVRGRLSGFTMDRLFRFLGRLGCQVDIVVYPVAPRGTKTSAPLRVIAEAQASGLYSGKQPASR